MAKQKRIAWFLAVMMIVSILSIFGEPTPIQAAGPALSKTKIDINMAEQSEAASVFIYNIPMYANVSWRVSSSGLEVQRSQSGGNEFFLYPGKKGKYIINFHVDEVNLKCQVNVIKKKITFKRNSKSLNDGIGKKFDAYSTSLCLYPGEATTLKLKNLKAGLAKWTSTNKSVAIVSKKGKVKAKNYGYTLVTATYMGVSHTYPVSVTYKTAAKALRYAAKHYHSQYSQPKRMSNGYYDCSSYVWRSYAAAGRTLGGSSGYAPTAADLAKWCWNNGYAIFDGPISTARLLPGDLIFETGADNGRFKGIYHVDLFSGFGYSMTVARTKFGAETWGIVARPCKGSAVTASPKGKSDVFSNYVHWSESKTFGANQYLVYRSASAKGKYQYIGKAKNTTFYYDTKVKNGKKYYYKVKALWKCKKGFYGKLGGSSKAVKKKKGTPGKPVADCQVNGIRISWEPIKGTTSYQLYRKNGSRWRCIAKLSGKKKSYVDKNVASGNKYSYRIKAYKGKESSGNSKEVSQRFYASPTVQSCKSVQGGLQLTWQKVQGVSMYLVYKKGEETYDEWEKLGVVSNNSYLDTTVTDGSARSYSIQCLDKNGKALSCFKASNSTFTYYGTPVLDECRFDEDDECVDLEWSSSAGRFRVLRRVKGESDWMVLTETGNNYYSDADLISDSTYEYMVEVIGSDGKPTGIKSLAAEVVCKFNHEEETDPTENEEDPTEEYVTEEEWILTEDW